MFSFLVGLFFSWFGFLVESSDILIILSIKQPHSCKNEGKVISPESNRDLFKAGKEEGLCSSLGEDGNRANDCSEGGQMEFKPLQSSGQSELRICGRRWLGGPGCKAAFPAPHSSPCVHHRIS